MTSPPTISVADIAAMRQQGDLGGFLQALTGRTPAERRAAPPASPEAPRGRPGAWPAGCQRPGPPPPVPDAVVQAAVADYRAWVAAGSPDVPVRCDCAPCRHTTPTDHAQERR